MRDAGAKTNGRGAGPIWAVVALAAVGGCDHLPWFSPKLTSSPPVKQEVPAPIDQLLPRKIDVLVWTDASVRNERGGVSGVEVRLTAKDSYGDATKAFGKFRFELFHYQPNSADPKGARIAAWDNVDLDLSDVKRHRRHWDGYHDWHLFKLGWRQNIPAGMKLVLLVTFESAFTDRLTAEHEFTAGQ